MSISIQDVSVPIFVNALRNMSAWLDKAASEKPEAELLISRLAPDMKPLPAQYQMASDSAKNAVARLAGIEAPSMPDVETTFAELKVKFPNGMGYRSNGQAYLTGFALPNFFFHVTTAYGILRGAGVSLGKLDYLQHLGPPNIHTAK
jgi:hypothetical protein